MSRLRFRLPALVVAALCALASVGVGTANADECGGGRSYRRSYYRYSERGGYVPRPVPYYPVAYPRAYCPPAPCYRPVPYYGGGGFGFSFSFGRGYGGGYDRPYYRPRCGW
jgi:hypothetical protein